MPLLLIPCWALAVDPSLGSPQLSTGIKHPVLLAGMAGAAGPELAAAVTNAGGIPSYSPQEGAPQGNRQGNIIAL